MSEEYQTQQRIKQIEQRLLKSDMGSAKDHFTMLEHAATDLNFLIQEWYAAQNELYDLRYSKQSSSR